jgi:hypothetical protein
MLEQYQRCETPIADGMFPVAVSGGLLEPSPLSSQQQTPSGYLPQSSGTILCIAALQA